MFETSSGEVLPYISTYCHAAKKLVSTASLFYVPGVSLSGISRHALFERVRVFQKILSRYSFTIFMYSQN